MPDLIIVGDRINPGFKSTNALIENEDIAGLQALAVRQVQAGAHYLDVTIGQRGSDDPQFLGEVIKALQDAVEVPLCFDYPNLAVQETCLKAYDPAKAGGRKPIVNSLAETRMEMLELLKIRPFEAVIMASEYLDGGVPKPARRCEDVAGVARRLSDVLIRDHGFAAREIFVDITINSLVSDTRGLTRMALDAIRQIRRDPALRGVHVIGGLTNIGNMLPPLEIDGVRLRHIMESAFLTVAIPLGFDTVMGTPWNPFVILPADDVVLQTFKEVTELTGMDAIRRLRKLWAT
ncbi:MAG: dihydropteroate synthase [Gammaproteobacteria bacterium]|nr:dihydropteroate synthase [Gammaproteobacteria bacterium]